MTLTDAPSTWGEPRRREVTWYDPAIGARQGLQMAGIDYLRAIQRGELPPAPIGGLLQFDVAEVEPGRVSFTCMPDESAYNPIGVVHGGLVCTLLDSVTACAVHSTLPLGKGYTSIEIKVSYLRAVTAQSGLLTATGTLVKGGSRVAFSEGVVTDGSGTPVATATSTCLVFDLPS
ncbi:MAG TPA: PaaI family thioesterase [Nocardioides sp.]|uniref:PaaI family thioesterase n=1 Tax=uncultured Nocardioides sp. TaxID=198441 RepID=UPI000EBA5D39|nr:PaaI family thioesterase [uncultured Nocardioides sp.]HCB03562.1 aromatic compound degradation protein PaaI [Nocardioides sp.]HRD60960.1 PaaI family thioesterase [Nocardioides sp.]HRI97765.1 PaaI family thioesterase [Nocardioides sp.]HRK47478.1 PaaI family thioesterase [Nocardioides sp.]